MGWYIVWTGLVTGIGTIGVFVWAYDTTGLRHAQTMAFFTLVAFQIFHVLAIRSERDTLWTIGLWSNPELIMVAVATMGLQIALMYVPVLQATFHTSALSLTELAGCAAVASTVYLAVEGGKWWRHRRSARGGTNHEPGDTHEDTSIGIRH
jgi:Ca2+-transporting ATPase